MQFFLNHTGHLILDHIDIVSGICQLIKFQGSARKNVRAGQSITCVGVCKKNIKNTYIFAGHNYVLLWYQGIVRVKLKVSIIAL